MKPFFHATLGAVQGAWTIGLTIALALAIFVGLPAVLRRADKHAGRPLAQARVAASSGKAMFRTGGALYRFTAYERHLVVCLLFARAYSWQHVRVVHDKHVHNGKLTIAVHGVRVELWGNARSVERLAKAISQQGDGSTPPLL